MRWSVIGYQAFTARLDVTGSNSRSLQALLAASTDPTIIPRGMPSVSDGGTNDDIDPEIIKHVEGAQNGNAQSFSVLYDRYVDKVYAYCYHRVGNTQTAEDLTADVFMRALKRIDSFSWKGKDFGAWLITIARNRCHDHFKSSRFRLESSVAEVHESAMPKTADAGPERSMELQDLRTQVHDAMRQLKSEQAEVLYHRFLQGYDVQTTAEIMGKKSGAIRALQYRALKALSQHVDVEALL